VSSDDGISVRRIRAAESLTLRDLRVRSLADAPDAFGQRLHEAVAVPDAEWRQMARASANGPGRSWILAFKEAQPVGLVQGRRRPPSTLLLFSLWVDPEARRGSVGRRLIEALEDWSAGWGATETDLWVHAGNTPALAFYRELGFQVLEDGDDAASGKRFDALALRRGQPSPDALTRRPTS
jgi:ribosomal protein S18 acetylase RimI-like enzyme